MKKEKLSESYFVKQAFSQVKRLPNLTASLEVPILGRVADLVCVTDGVVLSFEFKLEDWGKAISQAKDHKFVADYAYICMPKRRITQKMRTQIVQAGIGLVFANERGEWPFDTQIQAPKSNIIWEKARERVLHYLEA